MEVCVVLELAIGVWARSGDGVEDGEVGSGGHVGGDVFWVEIEWVGVEVGVFVGGGRGEWLIVRGLWGILGWFVAAG